MERGIKEQMESRAYNRLEAGAESGRCGIYLSSISELERVALFSRLEYERLERKYKDMRELYLSCGESWHETLFVSLFKSLSCTKNKEPFMELARRVGYKSVLHERTSLENVEALLLCASGLLEIYPKDAYILKLRNSGEYLLRKYKIEPLHHSVWELNRHRPANHPAIRIAQAAQLFASKQLFFDRVIECETLRDVRELFGVEASTYWQTHYLPGKVSRGGDSMVKRIGEVKSNLIGINLVVIMQYAYGSYTANEQIIDRAEKLNESLLPEDNVYIKRWKSNHLTPRCAFDSQAMIQLYTEHCMKRGCRNCPVGHKAIKNLSWIEDHK